MTWGTYLAILTVIVVWRVLDRVRSRTDGGPPVKRADISGFRAVPPALPPASSVSPELTTREGGRAPLDVTETPGD